MLPRAFRQVLPALAGPGWRTDFRPWRPTRPQAHLLACHTSGIALYLVACPHTREDTEQDDWQHKNLHAFLSPDGVRWHKMPGKRPIQRLQTIAATKTIEPRDLALPLGDLPYALQGSCTCGKEKFTEAQAVKALTKAVLTGARRERSGRDSRRRERRMYRCPNNPQVFHLTSMASTGQMPPRPRLH